MDADVNTAATGESPQRRLLAWASGGHGAPRARARRMLSASQVTVALAVVAIGTTLLCAAIGYGLARQSDERLWLEQRASLRAAIVEFRNLFGNTGKVDPRFVQIVAQSAGLKALKFETDPPAGERETQPVMDAQGRIAGFFTWDRAYPMTRTMNRLMPLVAGIAVVLVGFAGFSFWQLRRAQHDIKASEEQARDAADKDKLTGLPNHAKMLELLDLALASRAEDEVTTFALIELDGMADVNAQLGVLGGDDLIVGGGPPTGAGAPGRSRLRPHRQRRVCLDADRRRRRRCGGHHPCRARRHRTTAVDRHRGAGQRACRFCAGAARRYHPRRTNPARRAGARRCGKEGSRQHRRLRAFHRYRFGRPEIHPARIAARAQRQRTGAALPADRLRTGRPHRRRRGAAALDPCGARADRAGDVHSGRRTDGADGIAGRLRFAPRAERGQTLAQSLRRGEPVAVAGAPPRHRRRSARRAGRERRAGRRA